VITSGKIKWGKHVIRVGEMMKEYNSLIRIPQQKCPLRTPRRKSEDNIEIQLKNKDNLLTGFNWLRA
jgi:hypothetical protein